MSFDPSSYSNSDLMTSSHAQYDAPFDPSSYDNYNLMTSQHAQPNAPFNPSSYDNSNLMMSSYGAYSDMAQVKSVSNDPFGLQRKTVQHNSNALAWDEVKESDELNEPYGGLSSKPKSTHIFSYNGSECAHPSGKNKVRTSNGYNKSRSMHTNNLSQSKNICEQNSQSRPNLHIGISNTHHEHMLSTKDREYVKKINNDKLTALMNAGDRAAKKGNFVDEMLAHRKVQETMSKSKDKGGKYQLKYRHSDPESKRAFGYNSCMIHDKYYTQYYYSLGYKFDDIFEQDPKGPIGAYRLIKEDEYDNDPNAVEYINMSRTTDNRVQNHISTNKSKPSKRRKRNKKMHNCIV